MTIRPALEALEFLWKWSKPKEKTIRKPRILIVEDSPVDATLLQENLSYCGYESNLALNAEAAQALIRRNSIDVIFVDMRLTYMNGWELIPLIWRNSPHSLVVVTCTLLEDLARIPRPHHLFSVLPKPVSAEDLSVLFDKLKL